MTNLLFYRIRKKTGAEDVEYTIDDKDFQKRYEGKLDKQGGENKSATITPGISTKKEEGARKSGNATPAPANSIKATGGGGFASTKPIPATGNNA